MSLSSPHRLTVRPHHRVMRTRSPFVTSGCSCSRETHSISLRCRRPWQARTRCSRVSAPVQPQAHHAVFSRRRQYRAGDARQWGEPARGRLPARAFHLQARPGCLHAATSHQRSISSQDPRGRARRAETEDGQATVERGLRDLDRRPPGAAGSVTSAASLLLY